MPWYVVLTKPRQEDRAAEHLLEQGGEVFLPKLDVEKISRGKKTKKTEVLFPGYLFLAIAEGHSLINKVRSTPGARQLLSFVNSPVVVDERLINDIKMRSSNTAASSLFRSGQKVHLIDGPFKDYEALFHKYDGDERAIILLNLLSQQNQLVVDIVSLAAQN